VGRPTTPCRQCGAAVYAPPSWRKRGRGQFCSRACQATASLETRACPCGAAFTVKRGLPKRFCSAACAGLAQRKAWGPCTMCGEPDGAMYGHQRTPIRADGARYGVAGKVCHACRARLYRQEKAEGRSRA
jgi:hypothetical protein